MSEEELYVADKSDEATEPEPDGKVAVGQQLLLVAGVLTLIFGSTATTALISYFNKQHDDTQNATVLEPVEDRVDETEGEGAFSEINIVGRSAYVFDVANQRALYKKNEAEVLPLASVTKLMTALVAHELLTEDSSVTVNNQAIEQDGDSGLLENERFKRQTLSDLVLQSSSNDGAFALAIAAGNTLEAGSGADSFVQAMNVRAKEIGLSDTTYNNPTGLDLSPQVAGAYGTARDMAFLMEYIVKYNPAILEATRDLNTTIYSNDGFSHDSENTNYYINEIPGLIGSKTGYTDLAGGNLVIAYDAGLNRPIVIAVLGSTQTSRFSDVLKLVTASNEYLNQ